jgi:hypothetical protein
MNFEFTVNHPANKAIRYSCEAFVRYDEGDADTGVAAGVYVVLSGYWVGSGSRRKWQPAFAGENPPSIDFWLRDQAEKHAPSYEDYMAWCDNEGAEFLHSERESLDGGVL